MNHRKLFLVALLLVISGLFSQFTALRFAARANSLLTKAMKVPGDADRLRADRVRIDHRALLAFYLGVACAVSSALFAFLSHRAGESAPRFIVVVLLLLYGLLQLAAV